MSVYLLFDGGVVIFLRELRNSGKHSNCKPEECQRKAEKRPVFRDQPLGRHSSVAQCFPSPTSFIRP